jgi:2-C-methyl-D-erythritol 4-phosphate cytidylyltransferase
LGGLTVLEHTLLTFESDPLIHQILVVAAAEWLDSTQEIVMGSGAQKVCGVIPGGATRNGSGLWHAAATGRSAEVGAK